MPLISIATDPAVGGTFLAWSILWLSGQTHHYNVRSGQNQSVTPDPLTTNNAHAFCVNHARNQTELEQFLTELSQLSDDSVQLVYFHNFERPNYTGPADKSWLFDPELDQQAIQLAGELSDYIIRIKLPKHHHLYYTKLEPRSLRKKWRDPTQFNETAKQQHEDFIEYFFGSDLRQWQSLDLNEIWDQREFLALNLRPELTASFADSAFTDHDHYGLIAGDHWFCLDRAICYLLDHLGLRRDMQQWNRWMDIYPKWSAIHYERMQFVWAFDQIMQSILHGRNMDLQRFNLDIVREAVIQHYLLYQHNLNLRSHGINKFVDTYQLHQLLEPNTCHQLDQIYQSQPNSI